MKKIIVSIVILHSFVMNGTMAKLFILVGPSGVGKSTIITKLIQQGVHLESLVSHTTRAKRPTEVHGKDYFFISVETYAEKAKKDEFLLPANIYGNYYGMCKNYINSMLAKNIPCICSVSYDSAPEIKKIYKDAVIIFITPPSLEELRNRLIARNTENEDSLQKRLSSAPKELLHQNDFDFSVQNEDLNEAVEAIKKIIHS